MQPHQFQSALNAQGDCGSYTHFSFEKCYGHLQRMCSICCPAERWQTAQSAKLNCEGNFTLTGRGTQLGPLWKTMSNIRRSQLGISFPVLHYLAAQIKDGIPTQIERSLGSMRNTRPAILHLVMPRETSCPGWKQAGITGCRIAAWVSSRWSPRFHLHRGGSVTDIPCHYVGIP